MRFNSYFVVFAALLLFSPKANADILWTNPITGTNPGLTNPYTANQTVIAGITVSGIGRSGVSGASANDRYSTSGWNVASLDATKYIEFTLTPDLGNTLNFTNLVYTGQASGTGPTSFAFRSSVDSYASNLGTPLATGATIDLSGSAFQGITGAISFRLYGWGASGAAGTFSVNDFTFNGTVAVVPEPSSMILASCVFLGAGAGYVRRNRKFKTATIHSRI